jgi:hypothetical protein
MSKDLYHFLKTGLRHEKNITFNNSIGIIYM